MNWLKNRSLILAALLMGGIILHLWLNGGVDSSYAKPEGTILTPLQSYLNRLINQILPYPQNKILAGMLLGVDDIPFTLKQQFKSTSTVHILVVSGQNLSILAGFLMALTPYFGVKKTIVLNLIMVVCYSLLTGLGVPVIRAAVMAILVLVSKLINQKSNSLLVFLFSGLLMLLYNPNWLLSISFQLSYLATFGALIAPKLLDPYFQSVPEFIRQDLEVSVATHLLTLPIIAYNFEQVSIIGIVVNLLVLWTVSFIMILGIVGVVGGLGSLFFGKLLGLASSVLLSYMITIISFFAAFPYAQVTFPTTNLVVWLGYYLIIFAIGWKLVYLNND